MVKRLIAFLGLGQTRYAVADRKRGYEPIVYEHAGERSQRVELVQAALDQILGPFDHVTLFATDEAKELWRSSLSSAWRDVPLTRVPNGKTDADHWTIFEAVVRALDEAPADAEVVFDVTHGYRVQPMVGIAALTFWFSERVRRGAVAPSVRVTYGAFEAATEIEGTKVAPIWDLTTLVLVARWNAALDALMRYGRADDMERLASEIGTPARKKAHAEQDTAARDQATYLVSLGRAAKGYADDLALARLRDLMTGSKGKGGSAAELAELLAKQDAGRLMDRIPALRGAMEDLKRDVAPLRATSVLAPASFPSWVHLAGIYGRLQRFAEQAMVLREGVITRYGHLTSNVGPEPGTPGSKEARGRLERDLGGLAEQYRHGKQEEKEKFRRTYANRLREIVDLANAVYEPRNDIEHGGLNDQPSSAKDLRASLEALRSRLAGPNPVALVNLTNHAVSTWSVAQAEAARGLGLGDPVDLDGGMPLVDPAAPTADVKKQADTIADRVVAMNASAAVVQGENTLSFALVAELQRRGVRCFAATTARDVRAAPSADGAATIRTSEFRFVAFREYPAAG